MAYVLAHHIISPLGKTSEENYRAVEAGKTGIKSYPSGMLQMPDAFTASLHLGDEEIGKDSHDLFDNDFERLAFYSASHAMQSAGMDIGKGQEEAKRIVFILSSTKGDVEGMTPLADSAQRIASRLGILSQPVVVCNACISGLSALILADRLLAQNQYDIAVVCGCDVPRRFIISGFHSLKALSSEPCRPFDMERFGLNLGEAAATIVLGRQAQQAGMDAKSLWQIGRGYVKNDAFHISAPSKTSEGLYAALAETLKNVPAKELAFVNAHGTATLFNDQMESVAIQRSGLSEVPVNALKGYFGHTLGAAGILETILGMLSVDHHCILGTKGFEELGVSGKVNISAEHRATDKQSFIKMLSGFGGCNATMLASSQAGDTEGIVASSLAADSVSSGRKVNYTKEHLVRITPDGAMVDGKVLELQPQNGMLTSIYKQYVGNYPKYYKMDGLSRLGFVASELLLQAEGKKNAGANEHADAAGNAKEDVAIVLFNHSSSVDADRKYMETITDSEAYFPSPSVFVYTLPNIVTGEIAIRNQIHGETSFYILPSKNEQQMEEILEASFADEQTQEILTGWLNYDDEQHYEAELFIARRA